MLQSKYFRTCLAIIAFLTILYLGSKVIFLFTPLVSIIQLLLVPMMLSGFMYYLLRPIVNYLGTKNVNRGLSVLLIYLVFAGLFVLFWVLVWPTLRERIRTSSTIRHIWSRVYRISSTSSRMIRRSPASSRVIQM